MPRETHGPETPLSIGRVGLKVRDLPLMVGFYTEILGLEPVVGDAERIQLGIDGVPLVDLLHRPNLPPDDKREAGLFHTAFLLPSRADLGAWLRHSTRKNYPLTGAADHSVSEAIYLDDPEGNGVEIYRDRPKAEWVWRDGRVEMPSVRLDLNALAADTQKGFPGAPGGTRIGHVHLRVGAVAQAQDFYSDALGLDVTRKRDDGAVFMSSGGYHHHIAANVWQSKGAGRSDDERAGLSYVVLHATDDAVIEATAARLKSHGVHSTLSPDGFLTVDDPWGLRLLISR